MDEDIQQRLSERRYAESFDRLVERYQEKVFRLALSILRDPAQAEDAAQEVFLKLWRALPDYNGAASLSTWLYTIARNTCLTQLRRRAYRRALSLDEPAVRSRADSVAHASPDTSATLEVKGLLACLPEQSRQLLSLFYLQEKSYEEVAAMMGMPVGTVKSYIHRAKRDLGEMVTPRKGEASGTGSGEKKE